MGPFPHSRKARVEQLCCSCPREVTSEAGDCFTPSRIRPDGRVLVDPRCCTGTFPTLRVRGARGDSLPQFLESTLGSDKANALIEELNSNPGLSAEDRTPAHCLEACGDKKSRCYEHCLRLSAAAPVPKPSAPSVAAQAAGNTAAELAREAGESPAAQEAVGEAAARYAAETASGLPPPRDLEERAQLAAASAGAAANVFVGRPVPVLYEASAAAAAAKEAAPEVLFFLVSIVGSVAQRIVLQVVTSERAVTVAKEESGREKVASAATREVVVDELIAEGLPSVKVCCGFVFFLFCLLNKSFPPGGGRSVRGRQGGRQRRAAGD